MGMSDKNTQQSSSSSTGEGAGQTTNFGIGGKASNLQMTLSSGEKARRRRQQLQNKPSGGGKDKEGK